MMGIKKALLFLILIFNIVLTQNPSASFEYDEYLIDETSDRASVTLQIENPDLIDMGGITIFLFADTSVIKFDLQSVSWNMDTPFQHESLVINVDNDTLKIAAVSTQEAEIFMVSFAKIFDISFEIVGKENDMTLIDFAKFQIQSNYTENTPTNIILVGEDSEEPPTLGCMDVEACNYNSAAVTDDGTCEYSSCDLGCGPNQPAPSGCDDICGSTLELDDCGDCGGDNAAMDECGLCDGNNYYIDCVDKVLETCSIMDCSGTCINNSDSLTPCGDCSDDSNCNFSVGIATMDNNFRSENIEIPISLYDFSFAGFSSISPETQGFEAMEFKIIFDSQLLEINPADSSVVLFEGLSFGFNEISPGVISATLIDVANPELYQSINGEIVILSFDVIESEYTRDLHGGTSLINIHLTSLNGVNVFQDNIEDTGTLTIYTKGCIDPFVSTIDSNFICHVDDDVGDDDVCDESGILQDSNILNDGCILPEFDFEDILNGQSEATAKIVIQGPSEAYTLTIPEGTNITFPDGETSLDIISSASVDINILPDIAPGAQLAGPLVGLYPFGTTFDLPIEFLFTFEDLSRGISEYKILYMDDIQVGDWEEIGTCTTGENNFRFCNIEELSRSGLFIVMYGENLGINESIIPTNFNLYRSYPNPFNPTTTLEFDIANSGIVNFTVYNINGQIVESISPRFYTPGNYNIRWEAQDFTSGIYLIQMRTESSIHLQKVMLLK